MANLTCSAVIRTCAVRFAVLNAAGATPSGEGNTIVTASMIELTLEPEIQDGDEITERTSCGDYCVDVKDGDRTRWWNATLRLCERDMEIAAMIADFAKLTVASDTVGGTHPPLGTVNPGNGVSLEWWAWNLDDDGQVQDATNPYRQFIAPRTKGWRPTGMTFSNSTVPMEFVGRIFTPGSIGNGAANDWGAHDLTTGPISERVTATLPEASCEPSTTPAQP